MKEMTRIALLASGTGSNVRNIIQYFADRKDVTVCLVATNNPQAGVLSIAAEYQVPTYLLTRDNFSRSNEFLNYLKQQEVDFVFLAGFLWMIPPDLVRAMSGRMLNIHPALLPKFGGKGMYGHHVHQAVFEAKESQSGITIHQVNEAYDEGDIYFQATVDLNASDTPQSIEKKVRALEIEYYPMIIDRFIKENS